MNVNGLMSRSTCMVYQHIAKNRLFHGGVAEWLCSGLQSRGRRFDSDPRLQQKTNQLDSA